MAKSLFFLSLSLLFVTFIAPAHSSNPDKSIVSSQSSLQSSRAHTELIKYGFPIGLLPTNVLTYDLNATSGVFAIHLDDNCKLTLPPDNYLATYSKKITGKIVEGRIADLDGIRVWAFFKWWGITGIRSNGDDLVFEVGMLTAKYPSKNFDELPACEGRKQSKHSSS